MLARRAGQCHQARLVLGLDLGTEQANRREQIGRLGAEHGGAGSLKGQFVDFGSCEEAIDGGAERETRAAGETARGGGFIRPADGPEQRARLALPPGNELVGQFVGNEEIDHRARPVPEQVGAGKTAGVDETD